MNKKHKNLSQYLIQKLQDAEFATMYLNETLADDDQRVFLLALKNVKVAQNADKAIFAEKEQWLFDSKNKAIVDELKEALKQKADRYVNLGFFEEEYYALC